MESDKIRLDKKSNFLLNGPEQKLNFTTLPEVDLGWFKHVDRLFDRHCQKTMKDVKNVFEIVVDDKDIPNMFEKPLSTIKRLSSYGGGAFYTKFVRYLVSKGPCRVYDFQREPMSFIKRVLSKGVVGYDNYWTDNYPTDFVSTSQGPYDYVIGYHCQNVLTNDWLAKTFFSSISDNTDAFIFYFDPFVASRVKDLKLDFRFLKKDDEKVYYDIGGSSYADPYVSKNAILQQYGNKFLIDFLSLSQLDKKFNIGMEDYVNSARGVSNKAMWKCIRVVHIKSGRSPYIGNFGEAVDLCAEIVNVKAMTGGCIRPYMITASRISHLYSDLFWMANKADGVQAIVDYPRTANRPDKYNCYFHFRNGKVYGCNIKYTGSPIKFQATIVGDLDFRNDKISIKKIYYEDLIRGNNTDGTNFAARSVLARNAYTAGFPIIMKKWEVYDGQKLRVFGADSEGIVFQSNNTFRYKNRYTSEDHPCYFLVPNYTIDISVFDGDKFVLDGVTHTITEGSAPVREICVTRWDPFKYEFVRDRFDRSVQFHSYAGSDKNSMKSTFVEDYKEAITIQEYNYYISKIIRISGSLLLLYDFFKSGGDLQDLEDVHFSGVQALVCTGKSVLTTIDGEVHQGFYVWRDHFQGSKHIEKSVSISIDSLFPTSSDLDPVLAGLQGMDSKINIKMESY
jgi:hypothetical protein